jgi:choline-sulfatase
VNGSFGQAPSHDEKVLATALRFLREDTRRSAKPWAIYAGFTSPHYPFVADAKYASLYRPDKMPLPDVPLDYLIARHPVFEQLSNFQGVTTPIAADRIRRARAAYFGMITDLDRMVGVLMDELKRSGQMERTLVVYTTDHGEMLGDNGLWFKNVLLENAARVPLILAGAGLPSGRSVDMPVMHVDMVATMLETAGLPRDPKLRGESLLPLAQRQSVERPRAAYSESHSEGNCTGSFMIRKDRWKYIYATGYDPLVFDLLSDPREQHNLADKPETAQVLKELHAELLRFIPDPDDVTERAFAAQQELLDKMIRDHTRQQFYEALRSRLGAGQSRILANQFYRGRKA